jgi:hypothetical protein
VCLFASIYLLSLNVALTIEKFYLVKLIKGANIFIIEYVRMGTVLSRQLDFLSLSRRKSKSRAKLSRRTTEEVLGLNNSADHMSLNDNSVSSTDLHVVGELVPERYLVLLTEQMTEMLFRLMTFNETSILMSKSGSDHRTTLDFSVGNDDISTPIIMSNSNPINGQSSLQSQLMHQSCSKCKMKMLTIEEFRELLNAFSRVDSDHDNFLTRDEIRTTLNYLFELTEYDIQEILSVFDTNKDDRISLEEYIGMKTFL